MNARGLFIAGTDTEVGKTFVSCALLHALRAQGLCAVGMKPVAAGGFLDDAGILRNEDVEAIRQASAQQLDRDLINPFLLPLPMAPHLAARAAGVVIERAPILRACRVLQGQCEALLVEGVGGFRVPLGVDWDSADLARELALPVVLVVGLRLGCINHALLSVEAILARGLILAGWVANTVDAGMLSSADNVSALAERIPAPLLGHLPRLVPADACEAARQLDPSALNQVFSLLLPRENPKGV